MTLDTNVDLRSYVPRWLVERTAHEDAGRTEADIDQTNAAVIFADISGFTALTQRYLNKGELG